MMTQVLHCHYCRGIDIVRHGKSPEGQQRYRCRQCRVGTPALAQGKQAVLQHLKPEQCDRSPHGPGLRLCVWTTASHGLFGTHSVVGAFWYHALVHRRVGCRRAACGGGATHDWEGKYPENRAQHIHLRTRIQRLAHRTMCFSKPERMPDLVIGLLLNRYEFGVAVCHAHQQI
jgi:hypothetical protein